MRSTCAPGCSVKDEIVCDVLKATVLCITDVGSSERFTEMRTSLEIVKHLSTRLLSSISHSSMITSCFDNAARWTLRNIVLSRQFRISTIVVWSPTSRHKCWIEKDARKIFTNKIKRTCYGQCNAAETNSRQTTFAPQKATKKYLTFTAVRLFFPLFIYRSILCWCPRMTSSHQKVAHAFCTVLVLLRNTVPHRRKPETANT